MNELVKVKFYEDELDALFDGEKDTAKKLSDTVMTAIRYPMMTGDQEVIQKQFDEFAKLQGIVEIELADHKGIIKRSKTNNNFNCTQTKYHYACG